MIISERKAAVQAAIDRQIRTMGGDKLVIDACIRVGLVCIDYNHSACRAIQKAVDTGAEILEGGASC